MKPARILIQNTLVCLAIAFTTGCSTQKTWVYRSNTYTPASTCTQKKVAVLPFEDGRENKNSNLYMLYLIPGMPFGWQTLNAPEGISMHATSGLWVNYKPTEDFAKALAEDLKRTGLFSDAFFDYRKGTGDYAVTGKIISTKYSGYIISYCGSVYGPLLWFVGFPAATVRNDLSVELSLLDVKTDKVLFSKAYTAAPRKSVSWLYVMKNDFNYAEMLAEVNKQFCLDIQPTLLGAQQAAQAMR